MFFVSSYPGLTVVPPEIDFDGDERAPLAFVLRKTADFVHVRVSARAGDTDPSHSFIQGRWIARDQAIYLDRERLARSEIAITSPGYLPSRPSLDDVRDGHLFVELRRDPASYEYVVRLDGSREVDLSREVSPGEWMSVPGNDEFSFLSADPTARIRVVAGVLIESTIPHGVQTLDVPSQAGSVILRSAGAGKVFVSSVRDMTGMARPYRWEGGAYWPGESLCAPAIDEASRNTLSGLREGEYTIRVFDVGASSGQQTLAVTVPPAGGRATVMVRME